VPVRRAAAPVVAQSAPSESSDADTSTAPASAQETAAPAQTQPVATQAPAPVQAPARIVVQSTAPAPVAAQGPYAAVPAMQLAAAPRPAAQTCDGFLTNGCYLAKRRFSTPRGMELRCTMICE